mmetsp:Transcript_6238/g.11167  ORF Transcript_6238/g.11167 Transcript_6238/m.11167 type:complete len:130 (-) Transcript_6238:544-933(-)
MALTSRWSWAIICFLNFSKIIALLCDSFLIQGDPLQKQWFHHQTFHRFYCLSLFFAYELSNFVIVSLSPLHLSPTPEPVVPPLLPSQNSKKTAPHSVAEKHPPPREHLSNSPPQSERTVQINKSIHIPA